MGENGQCEIFKIKEEAFSSRNYSENKFNRRRTKDLPKYWLDALTTELWRTHGEQGRKLGS